MKKKVLTEVALFTGTVKRPKGYEQNNAQIKADILEAQLQHNTVTDSPTSYRFFDYKLKYSKDMGYIHEWVKEYAEVKHNLVLVEELSFGNIIQYAEQSFSRKVLEENDLKNEPDYVMVYAVDVYPDSAQVVIEYDNNKRRDKTWFQPLNTGDFALFPTNQRFFLAGNETKHPNTFLITTFKEV